MGSKKLVFKNGDGDVYSFDSESLVIIKFLSSTDTIAAFHFNSNDNTEIITVLIELNLGEELEFLRDLKDNMSFSKKGSIMIVDASSKYAVSKTIKKPSDPEDVMSVTVASIPSPVALNGNLNLVTIDNQYDISAGDITAVASLFSDNDVVFGGSIVDSSAPAPTALSSGSSIMTVDGKDSVGKVTFTSAAGAEGDVVTVTYGTASTNTRVPVVTPIGIDVTFTAYDNNGFTVRVGSTGVDVGGAFTYITQDYA
jgi:hypothetical protein